MSFFARVRGTNQSSNPDAVYQYDGNGKRIRKIADGEETIFVYNAGGQLVAEYSTQIETNPEVSYLTADHLGSPRIVTDALGNVRSRHDYLAFGDEVTVKVGNVAGRTSQQGYGEEDGVRKQYTGYERDDESGLDFAQARYYNPSHGRYTGVDPLTASADVKNPQTFNRYSYVLNSPYKFTDPLGLISSQTGACGQYCRNSNGGGSTMFDLMEMHGGGNGAAGMFAANARQTLSSTDKIKPPTDDEVEVSDLPSEDGIYSLRVAGQSAYALNDGVITDVDGNVVLDANGDPEKPENFGLDPEKHKYGFFIVVDYELKPNGAPGPDQGTITTLTEEISDSTLDGQSSSNTDGVGDPSKPVQGVTQESGKTLFKNADMIGIFSGSKNGPSQVSRSNQALKVTATIGGIKSTFTARTNRLTINPGGKVKIRITETERKPEPLF